MPSSFDGQWVKLNQGALEDPEREHVDGVEINLFMSPYNLPEAVRGHFDEASSRFVIEFKYLDDEKSVSVRGDDPVRFRIGKTTGRLLAIVLDVAGLGVRKVGLRMHIPPAEIKALASRVEREIRHYLRSTVNDDLRRKNYEVAEKAIAHTSDEIFKDLVEA